MKTILLPMCMALLTGQFAESQNAPNQLVPKRSSQVQDGFGINADFPRDPYIPANRRWWTRMFDAGVNFIRIGQYENSSDYTSWDWVERKRGEYSVVPELDDYVNSLVENGVHIEIQLLYGNPLYTGPANRRPSAITPEPGSFHNPDRSLYSVFWPPKTPEQIDAFTRYVAWMVNHFRGRVEYYEIWNEPNIEYWNPAPNPAEYGRLFKASAEVLHRTDPKAKIVFGGLSGADVEFAKRALDACDCSPAIDVFAYHNYPGYGANVNPEAVRSEPDTNISSKPLRDMVRVYPGIRSDLVFWDDEFNDGIPTWKNSDESVQAKYIPRGLIIDRATGVRTFAWLIAGATDGNELDDFGMLHGLLYKPEDFTPRPVFHTLQNTIALFSDSRPDASLMVSVQESSAAETKPVTYAFRSKSGKAIVAYWLPVLSQPGRTFKAQTITLQLADAGIQNPVLIDINTGKVSQISWKAGTSDTLDHLPLLDSVVAIADASYFDWPELPEAPSDLTVTKSPKGAELTWKVHEGNPETVIIERRMGPGGQWKQISDMPARTSSFIDPDGEVNGRVCYRVRASNSKGNSAYSNISSSPQR
jgi:hypothetical protein